MRPSRLSILLLATLQQLCGAASLPRDEQQLLSADLWNCMTRLSDLQGQPGGALRNWQEYVCDLGTDFVVLPRSALSAIPPNASDPDLNPMHREALARRQPHARRDDCKEDLEDLEEKYEKAEKELEDMKHERIGFIILAVGAGAFALVLAACLAAQVLRVKRGKKKYRVLSQQFDGSQVSQAIGAGAHHSTHDDGDAHRAHGSYDDPFTPKNDGHVPMRSVVSFSDTDTMVSGKKPGYGHDRFGSYSSVRSSGSEDTVRDDHSVASGSRPASRAGLPPSGLGKSSYGAKGDH
ncbi:uncharacterized protein SCHCODRAFT_02519100 [Schizophyllum commune H4-8]|uniref:Uncharacterized protein n=1 Tax=Schizophyllum commune (strain H4-8 / FGSC 9210) TaxID=578458 RepID=D8QI95_SCHCM|nr:uncharacterized protein SCHCODRAFT_02519100 [Schizophyllum commune H4-8]KAI5885915.1 hypothetical protein SCHCODRAFT_02519100 [Schizophyllum commune H4-8]